jgi:hypothetical protein
MTLLALGLHDGLDVFVKRWLREQAGSDQRKKQTPDHVDIITVCHVNFPWQSTFAKTEKLERMSFLDSLENNLKALEGRDQPGLEDPKRKESDRQRQASAAPWAERLKTSPYTQALMQQATRAGYRIRTKVNLVWIGTTLRLEARNHRLEFRPTADGVAVVFLKGAEELRRVLIDLSGSPEPILTEWMAILEAQKKEDEAAIAALPEEE